MWVRLKPDTTDAKTVRLKADTTDGNGPREDFDKPDRDFGSVWLQPDRGFR